MSTVAPENNKSSEESESSISKSTTTTTKKPPGPSDSSDPSAPAAPDSSDPTSSVPSSGPDSTEPDSHLTDSLSDLQKLAAKLPQTRAKSVREVLRHYLRKSFNSAPDMGPEHGGGQNQGPESSNLTMGNTNKTSEISEVCVTVTAAASASSDTGLKTKYNSSSGSAVLVSEDLDDITNINSQDNLLLEPSNSNLNVVTGEDIEADIIEDIIDPTDEDLNQNLEEWQHYATVKNCLFETEIASEHIEIRFPSPAESVTGMAYDIQRALLLSCTSQGRIAAIDMHRFSVQSGEGQLHSVFQGHPGGEDNELDTRLPERYLLL